MTLRVSDSVEKKRKELEGRQRDRDNGVYPAIVIAEGFASLKKMSVSGAVRKRNVCKAPVAIFRHAEDGQFNIVYRHPDGNIGWFDTVTPGRTLNPLATKPDQQLAESAHASLSKL